MNECADNPNVLFAHALPVELASLAGTARQWAALDIMLFQKNDVKSKLYFFYNLNFERYLSNKNVQVNFTNDSSVKVFDIKSRMFS